MIGYIYKIVNDDESVCYIGSTSQKITQRFSDHKRHYKQWKDGKVGCCMIYHEFDKYGVDAFTIELVEEIEYTDKCELFKRENYYISSIDCVNKRQAPTGLTRTEYTTQHGKQYRELNKDKIKQYREVNKDKICEYGKQYREVNKDKLNEKQKQYREVNKDKINESQNEKFGCDCGGKFTRSHKLQHLKTKKHQDYINSL